MYILPGKFRLKKCSISYLLIDHQLGEQRRRVVVVVVFAVDNSHIVIVIVDAIARDRNDVVILQLKYFAEFLKFYFGDLETSKTVFKEYNILKNSTVFFKKYSYSQKWYPATISYHLYSPRV